MSTLPHSDDPLAHSTLVDRGEAFYEQHLKTDLERDHIGRFVAIEPSSGQYFVGNTATAALTAASKAIPQSQVFLNRIGSETAHKIGG